MAKCTRAKPDGLRCNAQAKGGTAFCRWHSERPADVAAHEAQSRAGGYAKNAKHGLAETSALSVDEAVASLDLTTAGGLKELMAAVLRALTHVPLNARIATTMGNIAAIQRTVITESDIEQRIAALEAAQGNT